MSFQKVIGGGAMILALSGQASWAEVSPRDVWADWTTYMEAYGYRVSATETDRGDRLVLSDIELQVELPEGETEGGVTIALGDITLVGMAGGTVSVDIPDRMPILVTFTGEDGSGEAKLDYTTEGYEMIVSGAPEKMVYDYKASSVGLALTELTGAEDALEIATAIVTVADVVGQSRSETGDLHRMTQEMTTGVVRYAADFKSAEKSERFVWDGESASMTLNSRSDVPQSPDWSDMPALLKGGFAVSGDFGFGAGRSNFTVTEDGETVQGKSSSQGGTLAMRMNGERLGYEGRFDSLAMEIVGGDLPFPVAFDAAKAGFNLGMPLSKQDAPQKFDLGLLLGDFTMSDFIWGLFDPAAKLPRDPATLAIDLSGTMTVLTDLLSEENIASDEVPGEFNSVSLNEFRLSLAGTELTGRGAVEIDNSDLSSYDGMPKPVGDIELALKGGNTLLDTLVEIGLIPQEQALGARLMMGMFTVPVSGPDDLKTRIEFTENGQVLANGQRIK